MMITFAININIYEYTFILFYFGTRVFFTKEHLKVPPCCMQPHQADNNEFRAFLGRETNITQRTTAILRCAYTMLYHTDRAAVSSDASHIILYETRGRTHDAP